MNPRENRIIIHNIGNTLKEMIESSKKITIISPFISIKGLNLIVGDYSGEVTIITSWNPSYLMIDCSNLELYPLSLNNGWNLLINERLHAKIYSFDDSIVVIGSANCTMKGLSDDPQSNIEVASIHYDQSYNKIIDEIISSSIPATYDYYKQLYDWVSDNKISIPDTFPRPQPITNYIPQSNSPEDIWNILCGETTIDGDGIRDVELDIHKLYVRGAWKSYAEYIEYLRNWIDNHELFQDFLKFVDDEKYFGECRRWVKRYSKSKSLNIKNYDDTVHMLFGWITTIYSNYVWDVPHHSERIRRININQCPDR